MGAVKNEKVLDTEIQVCRFVTRGKLDDTGEVARIEIGRMELDFAFNSDQKDARLGTADIEKQLVGILLGLPDNQG